MTEPIDVHTAVLILETKLRRPTVSTQHVARLRLLEQLNASADRQLILVSAPAGYGKTALVSRWLDAVDCPYAWFSVDEHDDDLAAFLLYLVAAIRTVTHDAMGAIELLLQAPTLLAPHRLADALVQDMAALPGPFILAFDDYHTVSAPTIHALMARMVERLPAHVHLVLITRSDPPLPLDRLRGRQQLGEIRAADLRFSVEETWLLLQQVLGPGGTAETAALLEESTEGWAVGLHLAALSLRNRPDPATFARQIAEHGHQAITEYLLSEVLAGLPAALRDCLLQSAIFNRFCAPLIDVFQGEDSVKLAGDAFVSAIRRANLFVVPLDDQGTWFRYHPLFRELLLNRLGQAFGKVEIGAMHARAGAWFAREGLLDEAIAHALQADDPLQAASLVECHIHETLDREEWRQLERWIGLLPAAMRGRPRLLLAQAWLNVIRDQFSAIVAQLDSAEAAQTSEPPAATLRGEIATLRAAVAFGADDSTAMLRWATEGMRQLRPEMQYAMGLATFFYINGLQAAGRPAAASEVARQQLAIHGQYPTLILRVLLALCSVSYALADLPSMQSAATLLDQVAQRTGRGLSVAWATYAQSWLHYQRNDLAAAEQGFRRLEALFGSHGRATLDGFTGLALTLLAQGRPDQALAAVAALDTRLLERGMLALAPLAESLRQRVLLASDPAAALARGYRASEESLSLQFWEQPALTQVRTLIAGCAPDALAQAEELLAGQRARAAACHGLRNLIEIDALHALALAARGEEVAALAALRRAVELAAPGGALRLLVDCGPGLAGLLEKLASDGVAPAYVRRVLAALGAAPPYATAPGPIAGPPARPALAPAGRTITIDGVIESLTNREMDVLLLLAERLSDKEIAERLVLAPVTVKKHTLHIYRKLGVNNRRAAAEAARQLGLV